MGLSNFFLLGWNTLVLLAWLNFKLLSPKGVTCLQFLPNAQDTIGLLIIFYESIG